jgi:hypothetical protein
MSNQSCENDSGIVGSAGTVAINADQTGLGNQSGLEAQLQFAMNNILTETENNPVFGDILNNLFSKFWGAWSLGWIDYWVFIEIAYT